MKPRLLIVEDNFPSLFAMLEFFGSDGFDVDGTSSLTEALRLIETQRYSCVITDLRLGPRATEDGLLVAAAAAGSNRGKTPVILLTAHSTPEIRERALERDVLAVLSKPQTLPDIARITRELLEREGRDVR